MTLKPIDDLLFKIMPLLLKEGKAQYSSSEKESNDEAK